MSAVVALSLGMLAAACSPTFNWRDAPVGDEGLMALLPCKPDRATREMPLGAGGAAVKVDMAGCEAGGATFAVAHAVANDTDQATAWLDAWQRATRTQLSTDGVTETAVQVLNAVGNPAPRRIDTAAHARGERGAGTHVLWFAQLRGGKVSLYQATVLGQPSADDAVATFFEGLRLP
ncbi:MAG: hypothetical protein V4636_10085 [Pseudomonadota bacterium]